MCICTFSKVILESGKGKILRNKYLNTRYICLYLSINFTRYFNFFYYFLLDTIDTNLPMHGRSRINIVKYSKTRKKPFGKIILIMDVRKMFLVL